MRIPRVTAVEYVGGLSLRVAFDDGSFGEPDLRQYFEGHSGQLGELTNEALFAQAFVDVEAGCVSWPNGVDFDPLLLWSEATGNPLPVWATTEA